MVRFDHPIDFASAVGRFSVDPPLPGCDPGAVRAQARASTCALRPLPGGDGLQFDHRQATFAPNTKYTFTVAAGIKDLAGQSNSVDHRWELTSSAAPAVLRVDPADASRDVPSDSPLAVSFTRPMSESTTAGAISIAPPLEGTRVVRNQRDHARFVVVPGSLLVAGRAYQLVVTTAATDEHGQPIEAAVTARFTAGVMSAREHAVVLVERRNEAPSEVLLTDLAPLQEGEPAATRTLLSSPQTAYLAASVSPRGRWLAVVERDLGPSGGAQALRVIDLRDGRSAALLPSAGRPSWSSDERTFAFEQAGRIRLLRPADGVMTELPPGHPLSDSMVWAPDGQTIVLPTTAAGSVPGLELSNPELSTRYPVPTLEGSTSHPAISPDGGQLAVEHHSSSGAAQATLVPLAAPLPPGQRLSGDIRPIAYVDGATLLGIQRSSAPDPRLVRVNLTTGDVTAVDLGPRADPRTVVVSSSRRYLAFLADDSSGVRHAYAETSQGTGRRGLTEFDGSRLTTAAVGLN